MKGLICGILRYNPLNNNYSPKWKWLVANICNWERVR